MYSELSSRVLRLKIARFFFLAFRSLREMTFSFSASIVLCSVMCRVAVLRL